MYYSLDRRSTALLDYSFPGVHELILHPRVTTVATGTRGVKIQYSPVVEDAINGFPRTITTPLSSPGLQLHLRCLPSTSKYFLLVVAPPITISAIPGRQHLLQARRGFRYSESRTQDSRYVPLLFPCGDKSEAVDSRRLSSRFATPKSRTSETSQNLHRPLCYLPSTSVESYPAVSNPTCTLLPGHYATPFKMSLGEMLLPTYPYQKVSPYLTAPFLDRSSASSRPTPNDDCYTQAHPSLTKLT